MPPIVRAGIAVHDPQAVDLHIFHMNACKDGAEAINGIALPCPQVVLPLLVIAFDDPPQDGKSAPVRVRRQHGPLRQLQPNPAF